MNANSPRTRSPSQHEPHASTPMNDSTTWHMHRAPIIDTAVAMPTWALNISWVSTLNGTSNQCQKFNQIYNPLTLVVQRQEQWPSNHWKQRRQIGTKHMARLFSEKETACNWEQRQDQLDVGTHKHGIHFIAKIMINYFFPIGYVECNVMAFVAQVECANFTYIIPVCSSTLIDLPSFENWLCTNGMFQLWLDLDAIVTDMATLLVFKVH